MGKQQLWRPPALTRTGTALVLKDEQRREVEQHVARDLTLKYDKTGTILLVPQPSDDPNDPLVRSVDERRIDASR